LPLNRPWPDKARTLLHHVGEFVGEQSLSLRRTRGERPGGENDVMANRVGPRPYRLSRCRRGGISVDAYSAEVVTRPIGEVSLRGWVERLPLPARCRADKSIGPD
jgi:hypothetical protein